LNDDDNDGAAAAAAAKSAFASCTLSSIPSLTLTYRDSHFNEVVNSHHSGSPRQMCPWSLLPLLLMTWGVLSITSVWFQI
jgi:hypothetical protein